MMWQDLIDDAKEEGRQEGCQNLLKGMLSSMEHYRMK